MNEQGTIYTRQSEIDAARARGEKIEYLDGKATEEIRDTMNRHERRKQAKLRRQVANQARRKR
jgi:hypothetical protein